MFSFSIGQDNWIVICDFDLFKDAMNREEFQNRPVIEPLSDFIFRVSLRVRPKQNYIFTNMYSVHKSLVVFL